MREHAEPFASSATLCRGLGVPPGSDSNSSEGVPAPVHTLVAAGFLVRDEGLYWTAVPNAALFLRMCRDGAAELRRALARMCDADAESAEGAGEGARPRRKRARTVAALAAADRAGALLGVPAAAVCHERVALRTSFLGVPFHLADLLGRGDVVATTGPGGTLYTLPRGTERRDRRRRRTGLFALPSSRPD